MFLGRSAFLFSCYSTEELQVDRKGLRGYFLFLHDKVSEDYRNYANRPVKVLSPNQSVPTAYIIKGENLGVSTCSRKRNVEDLR